MKEIYVEKMDERLTVTVAIDSCKAGLRSLAALIAAMLLASASPNGALASHSSMVIVNLGRGERIFKAGVLKWLTAMNDTTSTSLGEK
jgi:hypothetical protein